MKMKRVRRVHADDTGEDEKWEEYDLRLERFVPLDTAVETEYIDVEEEEKTA